MIRVWKVVKSGEAKTISKEDTNILPYDTYFSLKEYPLFQDIPFKEFYALKKNDVWLVKIVKI